MLRGLLESLAAQTIERGALEVIVVDDGSAEPVKAIVERAVSGRVAIRSERQEPAGLNAARNLGASCSDGEVVAFLDDDTLAAPGWAEAMLAAFALPECAGVAGRIELAIDGPEPRWLAGNRSYLSELELGPRGRWLDEGPEPAGANCAVRRTELERLGGFRSELDRRGTSLVSNGDTEFFRRLRAGGGRIRYEPRAHVLHRIPRERLTLDYFRRRASAQGVSDELIEHLRRGPASTRSVAREWVRLGRAGPILARGLLQRRGTVNAQLWVAYCRGRLRATRRLRANS
jgi:glycosyltransferase involved in cell wall biosynthesis